MKLTDERDREWEFEWEEGALRNGKVEQYGTLKPIETNRAVVKGNRYHEIEIGGVKYGVEPYWEDYAEGSLPLEVNISNNGNPDGYNLVKLEDKS